MAIYKEERRANELEIFAKKLAIGVSLAIVLALLWMVREILILVDGDLHELQVLLLGDPFEHGRDGVTRAAPLRPEIDEHWGVVLEHLVLERCVGDFGCQFSFPFGFVRVTTYPVSQV